MHAWIFKHLGGQVVFRLFNACIFVFRYIRAGACIYACMSLSLALPAMHSHLH